jgi:hypothetical protein
VSEEVLIDLPCLLFGIVTFVAGYSLALTRIAYWRNSCLKAEQALRRLGLDPNEVTADFEEHRRSLH